jgi:hypothetical protein
MQGFYSNKISDLEIMVCEHFVLNEIMNSCLFDIK